MKPSPKLITLHVFLAVALAACGGGSSSVVPDNLSDIAWAIDAAAARQTVAGSEALTITLAQASQELAEIENNLDTAIAGDVVAYQGTGNLIRLSSTCSGLICTITSPDGTTDTINLSDSGPETGATESQLTWPTTEYLWGSLAIGMTRERRISLNFFRMEAGSRTALS